ncbi:hypothetical protein PPL_09703 [Heterostelium album PN500]|uniref:Uncharacterized protein n=1 Tax=Heterostelium pallidum (strain ATCC 26659 / Pp 5 / PN500) TaxID=670386 RepID=D3BNK0_HETP5|nr:hypothetical protein PPL_09703 [Heterostelium album PN500]EFA76951.1 hypothetical protein PPL_09703 [Heterostelium album PN500]|eukprot:XP_020429083.1 hypothetical protein PPL_09703 [Heterostelium album PN500]
MKRYHFSIFLFCIVLAFVDGKLVSRECDMACPDEYICSQPLKYLPPKCVPISLNTVTESVVVNGIDMSGNRLGSVPITPPHQFPGSELNQDKYSTTVWTSELPEEWSVSADGNHIQI